MVASASLSSPASDARANGNLHFYEEFCRMKLNKMSDADIYMALKQRFQLSNGSRRPTGKNSLKSVALHHFSQTLETNRIVVEKKKKLIGGSERLPRALSCGRLEIYHSDDDDPRLDEPIAPCEVSASSALPKKVLSIDVQSDEKSMPTPSKRSNKPKRPQLSVLTDMDDEVDDENANQVDNLARTPRVDGRISPGGAVHVGKFAISKKGLRYDVSGRRSPHAFLTAGKSDFVEIGYLGSGASSAIIEALHIPTLTIVALKMLPTSDSVELQYISSELSVLYQNLAELRLIDARLDEDSNDEREKKQSFSSPCEHVLALYDAFLDTKSGMVNLVIEYMDGGSLEDLVDRGGCQDEHVIADIAHQVLLGLDFLHSQNHMHRDIKPGNILVNCAGVVKIADFGVAKAMDINADNSNNEASFVGTMSYMAPERLKGQSYGVAADVWSFGLTLMAVVIGRYPLLKPNQKSDYWGLMKVVCDDDIPRLSGKFSGELKSFLYSCVLKIPAERASVKGLLQYPFVQSFCKSKLDSNGSSLSELTQKGRASKMESVIDSSDIMVMKYNHLETVLEKTELKYQHMVELWKSQDSLQTSGDDSIRSISFKSISMKTPAEPMTRLPNFTSGIEQWKHFAFQLHLPLDIVISTASSIVNRKYFAK